jgi:hypothetical protein
VLTPESLREGRWRLYRVEWEHHVAGRVVPWETVVLHDKVSGKMMFGIHRLPPDPWYQILLTLYYRSRN